MRLSVCNIQDVVSIKGDGCRPGEIHLERRTVSVEPVLTGADDGPNDAGFMIDLANAITAGIADVQVILGIECDIQGQVESGFAAGAFIAAIAGLADPGKIVKGAFLKVNAPDAVRS